MNYLRQSEQSERPSVLPKEMICLQREGRVRQRDRGRQREKDKVLLTLAFCIQTTSTCQAVVRAFSVSFTHTLACTRVLKDFPTNSHIKTEVEEASRFMNSHIMFLGKLMHTHLQTLEPYLSV